MQDTTKLQKASSSRFRRKSNSTKKIVLAAMFACMAYVLNTFVYFPAMAPFQHLVNVLAAVCLGPWYACAAAFLCGSLRMMSGRTIQAVVGAIFGPLLGGFLYRKTKNLYLACLGEIIGTGIIGAMVSYPLMKYIYHFDLQNWYYYIPFYTPSAVIGGVMGVLILLKFKRSGRLDRFVNDLNEEQYERVC